jgi:hypothetical protein
MFFNAVITQEGKRSMLKLARRMTENFCAGVSASSAREWSKLDGATGSIGEDVRVMARKSVDEPGEPPGVVLSAATSVWVPVAPGKLFNFLRDEQLRAEWDILSNGGPMQEMANIAKGQEHGNSVSLLRASVSIVCLLLPFCSFYIDSLFSNGMSSTVPQLTPLKSYTAGRLLKSLVIYRNSHSSLSHRITLSRSLELVVSYKCFIL